VDVSEVAIGKLGQAAGQLNVKINLFAVDAGEYDFEPAGFDLIVLFYHLDRGLFPKIVSALNPGGLFVCKMAVHWGPEIALAGANFGEWSNLWERSQSPRSARKPKATNAKGGFTTGRLRTPRNCAVRAVEPGPLIR
jgi:SAM-dependent methyltransferase